jgi:hypothetical protein
MAPHTQVPAPPTCHQKFVLEMDCTYKATLYLLLVICRQIPAKKLVSFPATLKNRSYDEKR